MPEKYLEMKSFLCMTDLICRFVITHALGAMVENALFKVNKLLITKFLHKAVSPLINVTCVTNLHIFAGRISLNR